VRLRLIYSYHLLMSLPSIHSLIPPHLLPDTRVIRSNSCTALADALHILGIGPIYHMRETMRDGHKDTWARALEAKYDGKGKPFGKEELDELLGDFAVRFSA
jgi:hypothetical protein